MKILVVAPQPYFVERGTPIAVRQLSRTLVKQGHDVHLLVYPIGQETKETGLSLHRCARVPFVSRVPIGFSIQKLLYDIPLSFSIFRLQQQNKFDVIHAVEEAVYPALLMKLFGNVRVVYDMDSSLADQMVSSKRWLRPLRRIFDWFESIAIRKSDQVAAVCDDLVDIASQSKSRASIHTLYDVPNFQGADGHEQKNVENLAKLVPDSAVIGVYVGNLEPYQGIDLLLQSICRIPDDSQLHTLIIGGSQDHIDHYCHMSDELGISGRVDFLGPRPLAHLDAILRQADVLLSPRITGGNTPMKLYSYMAAMRPIVATNLSTHTQVLDDQSAILVEPTPDSFAAGLNQLIESPALGKKLAERAESLVRKRYSIANYEKTLEGLYRVLDSASPSR